MDRSLQSLFKLLAYGGTFVSVAILSFFSSFLHNKSNGLYSLDEFLTPPEARADVPLSCDGGGGGDGATGCACQGGSPGPGNCDNNCACGTDGCGCCSSDSGSGGGGDGGGGDGGGGGSGY